MKSTRLSAAKNPSSKLVRNELRYVPYSVTNARVEGGSIGGGQQACGSLTVRPTSITTPSGSVVRLIPQQLSPVKEPPNVRIAVENSQHQRLAIITKATTQEVAQNARSQSSQALTTNLTKGNALNISTFIGGNGVGMLNNGTTVSPVPVATASSNSAFILKTTTAQSHSSGTSTQVSAFNQEMVKQIIVGGRTNITATTSLLKAQLPPQKPVNDYELKAATFSKRKALNIMNKASTVCKQQTTSHAIPPSPSQNASAASSHGNNSNTDGNTVAPLISPVSTSSMQYNPSKAATVGNESNSKSNTMNAVPISSTVDDYNPYSLLKKNVKDAGTMSGDELLGHSTLKKNTPTNTTVNDAYNPNSLLKKNIKISSVNTEDANGNSLLKKNVIDATKMEELNSSSLPIKHQNEPPMGIDDYHTTSLLKNIHDSSETTSPVIQISNSVTLTIAKPNAQKPLKPEFSCVTLEKNPKAIKMENRSIAAKPQSPMQKQESLLKSNTLPCVATELSPRAKRSRSLNNASSSSMAHIERRFSTASEGQLNGKSSIEAEKLATTAIDDNNTLTNTAASEEEFTDVKPDINMLNDEEKIDEIKMEFDENNVIKEERNPLTDSDLDYDPDKYNIGIQNISGPTDTEDEREESDTVIYFPFVAIKEEKLVSDEEETTTPSAMQEEANEMDEKLLVPIEKQLFCDEEIPPQSTTSLSECSPNTNSTVSNLNRRPATIESSTSPKKSELPSEITYSTVLEMLSIFNMLSWKERIGMARGTAMRFQLNEFNLLQIHERCQPRYSLRTAFEKPIYDRDTYIDEKVDSLSYLCRRCNCHGRADDFLAPEFCSLECLKRDSRKRRRPADAVNTNRRTRKATQALSSSPELIDDNTSAPSTKTAFNWATYLAQNAEGIAAPIHLFLNPFSAGPNGFRIGMKLEAIDPENCSLFCVCTIVNIRGFRLNLQFDGYMRIHNFWVNADSMDIFPPGWCVKSNRILQPPKGIEVSKFSWLSYLAKAKAIPAPRHLFTHLNSSSMTPRNLFLVGMHLEAEDLNDTGKLCVATVADVLGGRIRIHFDGWDDCYDYWVDINSPYIHPCGWHEGRQQLIVPPEFENYSFSWKDYIRNHSSGIAAPPEIFNAREPIDFRPKMKLEVVDPRNPILIRPATVVVRKGHRVKLHLDQWPPEYCFWLEDDSPDLHPVGWCRTTNHELEPPPGFELNAPLMPCRVSGCRGLGNAKYCNLNIHSTRDSCPYAFDNWNLKIEKPPRMQSRDIVRFEAMKSNLDKQLLLSKKDIEAINIVLRSGRCDKKTTHSINLTEIMHETQKIQTKPVINSKVKQDHEHNNKFYDNKLSVRGEDMMMADMKIVPESSLESKSSDACSDMSLEEVGLKIAKEYLCDYGPRLQQNYRLWQHNINLEFDEMINNPLDWTTSESCAFVRNILKCPIAEQNFADEDIDGQALLALHQSDLTDILKLKLGPAVKLFAHILQLRSWTALNLDKKEDDHETCN